MGASWSLKNLGANHTPRCVLCTPRIPRPNKADRASFVGAEDPSAEESTIRFIALEQDSWAERSIDGYSVLAHGPSAEPNIRRCFVFAQDANAEQNTSGFFCAFLAEDPCAEEHLLAASSLPRTPRRNESGPNWVFSEKVKPHHFWLLTDFRLGQVQQELSAPTSAARTTRRMWPCWPGRSG